MYDYNHIKNFKTRYYMWKIELEFWTYNLVQSGSLGPHNTHSFYPPLYRGRSKHISTIFKKEVGVWRVLFGEGLDGKWVVNIWRGCKAFRDSSYKFNFSTLIWPIIYLETEKSITCYFSLIYIVSLFYFITSFFVLFY